jgi:formylglycine-generating enzyme required for sulfatase activity
VSLWRILLVLIGFAGMLAAPASARAPARLALIIEQTNYTGDLSRVALAKSEADHIDKALKATGFKITRKADLTKSGLEDALGEFRAALEASGPDTIAFVYYTGHGLQHPQSGDSYLLGIDARLKTASDLAVYGLDLASQRDGFAATGTQAIFLVFDACRNVPALPGFKGNKKGIGRIEAEPDMLIAYSTRLNDVAEEGVYAPILAEELTRPGQTAETTFTAAQRRVQRSTARKQRPYTDMDLSNEVCFAGCAAPAPTSTSARTAADIVAAEEALSILEKALATASRKPGDVFRDKLKDGTEGPKMVVIPAGEFSMGSSITEAGRDLDEGMVRNVRIPRVLAVSSFEIMEMEYETCRRSGICPAPALTYSNDTNYPVIGSLYPVIVNWNEAKAYTEFLSLQTGQTYRLLTEAEWEYAARAGSVGRFHNGGDEKDICRIANIANDQDLVGLAQMNKLCNDGNRGVATAGQYHTNAFWLSDMLGNVWEWTEDCYQGSYEGAPSDGSARLSCSSTEKVIRGGAWDSRPALARLASREHKPPETRDATIGFRIARELD